MVISDDRGRGLSPRPAPLATPQRRAGLHYVLGKSRLIPSRFKHCTALSLSDPSEYAEDASSC